MTSVILPPSADSLTNFLSALNDPESLKASVSQLLSAVKDLDQRQAVLSKANEEARNLKDQHDKQAALIGEKVDYLNDQEQKLKIWEMALSDQRKTLDSRETFLSSKQDAWDRSVKEHSNLLASKENFISIKEQDLASKEAQLNEKETKVQETQDLLTKQLNKIKEITNG